MEKGQGEMDPCRSKRYDILVDAEGAGANDVLVLSGSRKRLFVDTLRCLAEDIAIEPGKEVSFLWRRNDKFYLSESSEVWDQGVVYWDACSTQVR